MKKINFFIFIVFILALVGCRPAYYYDYNKLKDDVEKIEIIELNYSQLENEATILKTLNSEETKEFLSEISKIRFDYPFGDPPSINGYCIRIYYKNQEYEVVAQGGTQRYDKEGKEIAWYKRRCSKDDFDNLILKFID